MIRSLVLLQLDKSRLWRIGIEMEQEEIHPAPIANYISSKINTPITYIDDNDNIFNANVEIDGCGFGIYLRRNFCSNRFRVIFISIFQMCICQMIRTNGNRNPRNDEERFPLCYMFEWFGVKTLLHLRTTTR